MKIRFIIAAICVLLFFRHSVADNLPDEQTLIVLQQKAAQTWSRFEGRAFVPLIDYYDSGFSSLDVSQSLYQLTVEYENLLKNIQSEQLNYKRLIEEYEGDDWDLRFGKNGLWRRFDSLTNQTSYLIAKCLYYRALCVQAQQLPPITDAILQRCAAIADGVNTLYSEMLEAQVYSLLSKESRNYYDDIFERLDRVQKAMNADTELYYEMWMCRLEMLKPFSKTQLNTVINNFRGSAQADNALIAMRLAFLQLQVGESSLLEENLEKFLPVADIIAHARYKTAFERFEEGKANDYISSLTHFERQLLAVASLSDNNRRFDIIISSFGIGKNLADRVLSYVAAVKNIDYNSEIAFDSAIFALSKPAFEGNVFSDIDDLEVLSAAVKAGFGLLKDQSYRDRVADAFERYKLTAGDDADVAVVFAYASAFLEIRPNRAIELLTEIYNGAGEYADKALFELLAVGFNDGEDISEDIASLYERCDREDVAFCTDVADLYCRSLALNGQAVKAMELLIEGYGKDWNFESNCGLYVLEKFLERCEIFIDEFGSKSKADALRIAEKILPYQKDNFSKRLVYIETAVITGKPIEEIGEFPQPDDSYETLLFSRSKARYLQTAGEYYEAAFIWGAIARALASADNLDLWRWQRAKYYQLECSKQSERITDEELLHSIDVLRADGNWKSGFWATKLIEITPEISQADADEVIRRQQP